MHKGNIIYQEGKVRVIDCKSCGFAHVNPLPSLNELNDFYEKRFYKDVKTSYFSDYERDHDWWALNYEDILKTFKKLSSSKSSGKKLLDIGSGPGLFLDVARKNGLEATGIEPSKDAFEYSRNKYKCKVLNTTLEELDSSKEKFDFIHSSLVLEHILDPQGFLKKSTSMLKKGGLMCVIVPNDFTIIQKINVILGRRMWWVSPFEHLNYFNQKSLRKLFDRSGFKVEYENVTFPIDLFLLMDQNYLDDPATGKNCHSMRKSFEFNLQKTGNGDLREKLYSAFSKLGIGRELIIFGRKK
ncbi:MAG: class I SAM-dependent methyltransferase [Bacteroidetes bacterium]|nr:MAG: class I SAM-dependent methyltransferase [Bacteroidota bacterium]